MELEEKVKPSFFRQEQLVDCVVASLFPCLCVCALKPRPSPHQLASPPVEVFQHSSVGSLKYPLLAGGGRVAGVHEDAVLGGAAVHAAAADRVVQSLILWVGGGGGGKQEVVSDIFV